MTPIYLWFELAFGVTLLDTMSGNVIIDDTRVIEHWGRLISGFAFKVSAAPFHMWTPDVYEGSPTPVTAFFATAPKVAAMGLFARVVFDAFGDVTDQWQQIVAFLSVLSINLIGDQLREWVDPRLRTL